jgi:hypothetical protein
VGFIKNASEESEEAMVKMDRPNAFIRDPIATKKEWDQVQALHPKCMMCTIALYLKGEAPKEFVQQLADVLMFDGDGEDVPLYLRIQRFHAAKISELIESGKTVDDYKCPFKKSLFDKLVMPSSKLLYRLDPNKTRSLDDVMTEVHPLVREYQAFLEQDTPRYNDTVSKWGLEKYLDVMDNFFLVSRIQHPDEPWGDFWFKCCCKHCHVNGCCRESMVWSMFLNHNLKMPAKYAVLEPHNRKKKGKPTEKRVAALRAAEEDARPFVDKAPPKVLAIAYRAERY